MRRLPTYIVAVVLSCTVDRVAHFFLTYMGAEPAPAWGFAVAIAVGAWVSAYLTREHVTTENAKRRRQSDNVRKQAAGWMMGFVVVDGVFNLSDVLLSLPPNTSIPLIIVACLYGLFPTVVAAGLGSLQGAVDRLPAGAKRRYPVVEALTSGIAAVITRWSTNAKRAQRKAAAATEPSAVSIPAPLYGCARCTLEGREWHSDPTLSSDQQQRQHAGHLSSHARADAKIGKQKGKYADIPR